MGQNGKVYFMSDSHLGAFGPSTSREREQLLVRWLDEVSRDAEAIYLLGDIFDFWFEYRRVVPKGYVRLLGKLAELTDRGIPVHYFRGNHDLWDFEYFRKELGVTMHKEPLEVSINGATFFIGHGDGLGPGDKGYKLMKWLFTCRLCQRVFAFLHPSLGMGLAGLLSKRSRVSNNKYNKESYRGEDHEYLVQYAKDILKKRKVDYFVFGHRHLPLALDLMPGVRYVNTGDWITYFTYAVFDGHTLSLRNYKEEITDK